MPRHVFLSRKGRPVRGVARHVLERIARAHESALKSRLADSVEGRPYYFERRAQLHYYDETRDPRPHLLLLDKEKRIRFVLSYIQQGNVLLINHVQRFWTVPKRPYSKDPVAQSKQRELTQQFAAETGVKRPEELLLEKLIYDNRALIADPHNTLRVFLNAHNRDEDWRRLYFSLRAGYFGRQVLIDSPYFASRKEEVYPLSLAKKRVKRLLD